MSFTEFIGAVDHPELLSIAHHWNTVRGDRRMPAWSDISPQAIAPFLANVWAWKFDGESRTFVGRLAGESIIEAFGASPRGREAGEYFREIGGEAIVAHMLRVVDERLLYVSKGPVFAFAGLPGHGIRIGFPLAADGEHPDGIFGATYYTFSRPVLATPPFRHRRTGAETLYFPVRT